MNAQRLQNEITACLRSEGLKAKIAEKGYTFTEEDLLGIAFHFAPSFDERIRLLRLLEEYAASVSNHAARCIAWQKTSLEQFKNKGAYEIYELRIQDEPYAYEERYLCESFDAALEMIDEFYKEYDCAPKPEQAHYVIEKRKILRSGKPFCEDGLGECVFSSGKVLVSVDSPWDETENGKCPHSCMDCSNPCVLNIEVRFPSFIEDRSPVRYRLPDGRIKFGIHLNFHHLEEMESVYIIPLDGEMLKGRAYDQDWGYHWH